MHPVYTRKSRNCIQAICAWVSAGQHPRSARHGLPARRSVQARYDRAGLPVDDGGMAAAGVIGAIRGHGANLFAQGDLIEQLRQARTVAVATGVNSTAQMSEVAMSIARCTLRH